jgi:hypothetical protein
MASFAKAILSLKVSDWKLGKLKEKSDFAFVTRKSKYIEIINEIEIEFLIEKSFGMVVIFMLVLLTSDEMKV